MGSSPHSELTEALRLARMWQSRPNVLQPSPEVSRLIARALLNLEEQYENACRQRDLLQREADCEHGMGEDARRVAREVMSERDSLKEQLEAARRDVAEWEERSHRFEHRTYDAEEQYESLRRAADKAVFQLRTSHDEYARLVGERLSGSLASNPAEKRDA